MRSIERRRRGFVQVCGHRPAAVPHTLSVVGKGTCGTSADAHSPSRIVLPGTTPHPLATSSGFVIGDDGVLIVDTMINRQLLCQVVDLVREQTTSPCSTP